MTVQQNENKPLNVKFEMNEDFGSNTMTIINEPVEPAM